MDGAHLPDYLPAAAKFALAVALGCCYILKPILDFIDATTSPRRPVLDAAVAVVLVALPVTYLMGVVLVYLHVTPPAAAPPGALRRRVADVACSLAFALLVAVAAFLLLAAAAADGSPPSASESLMVPT